MNSRQKNPSIQNPSSNYPMQDKIVFQHDKLTVYDTKLSIGNATVFYPNISASSIQEFRPLSVIGIMALVSSISLSIGCILAFLMVGSSFIFFSTLALLLGMVALTIGALLYRVTCLTIHMSEKPVAILKSKDRRILETAQIAIDTAKIEYHRANPQ